MSSMHSAYSILSTTHSDPCHLIGGTCLTSHPLICLVSDAATLQSLISDRYPSDMDNYWTLCSVVPCPFVQSRQSHVIADKVRVYMESYTLFTIIIIIAWEANHPYLQLRS